MDRVLAILLGLPAALLLVKYRRQVGDLIGPVSFAESFFGPGGTYTFVLLLALLTFILSLMYAFGTLQEILTGPLGQIFGAK